MNCDIHRLWLGVLLIAVVVASSPACRRGTAGTNQTNSANQNANSQASGTRPSFEDKGDLKLQYHPRKDSNSPTKVGSNPEALEKLIAELNERLILPFDIVVSFEDCDQPDASYDPEAHQVTICHQLFDAYHDLLETKIKDKKKLDDAIKATTAAVFFHELGHGLVDAWKIPITGREEDAVDQLSTLVLIEGTEDGEQMALAGAISFKLYADLDQTQRIYWDEHSLDEQRFFDTVCLVYGHDVKKYAYLVDDGTLPEERAVLCPDDYQRVSRAWRQLLGPYLKQPTQTRPKLKFR
jgi:hypothetical protein